jgi:hypothetical protein
MPTNKFVESAFWNFDAMFVPQQHPAREMQDTFYVKGELDPWNRQRNRNLTQSFLCGLKQTPSVPASHQQTITSESGRYTRPVDTVLSVTELPSRTRRVGSCCFEPILPPSRPICFTGSPTRREVSSHASCSVSTESSGKHKPTVQ